MTLINKQILAIVIPAYKREYLEASLLSIANQTDNNFTVYIGDDNSPYDLDRIIEPFKSDINIVYKKFTDNLGSTNLTLHWDRCIAMTKSEPWIWLFSDDDVMDENCVAEFKQALRITSSSFDLYRFNTRTIDIAGKVISNHNLHPQVESSIEFALDRLQLKRDSFVVEYIFSKQRYLEAGRFVSFPLAWSSDEATWINIGFDKGIYTINGAYVNWRYSNSNISSLSILAGEKIEATLQYLVWLKNWIIKHYPVDKKTLRKFENAKSNWLNHQLIILNNQYGLKESFKLSLNFKQRVSIPIITSLIFFGKLSIRPYTKQLKSFLKARVHSAK